MATQHISTSAVVAELDSDFENLSTMSSPALSSFSHITTSSNGGGGQTVLSDSENHIDNSDREEVQEEPASLLPPLTSFIPIIETLPGLLLEDNTYSVLKPLIGSNVETLISYARRIEELVLTDSGRDERPRVSQDTITRLAHVRDVNNPSSPSLLSSLKRLRLIDVDSELAYLWFCLTPSLQQLELSGIPPTRHTTIAAFLIELANNAPDLAHLTLGPGRLFPGALQVSLAFEHLRELRINDVADTVDFAFLQAVAALPELALFDINARTAKYAPYKPVADVDATKGRDPAVYARDNAEEISTSIGTEEEFVPFLRLTTLAVTGDVVLMHDLLLRLLPRGVERLSLTVVRRASGVVDDSTLPSQVPYHTFKRSNINIQLVCEGEHSPNTKPICPECKEKRRMKRLLKKQVHKSFLCYQAARLASTIDRILECASPQSIHINSADILPPSTGTTSVPLDPPMLPPSTLHKLLSCPSLVKLQVDNWILTSANKTILDLQNNSELPLPMQVLHLPIKESLHSSIALSTLPSVARLYPHLLDLQVRLVECTGAHARELELCVTDHGLKELSFSADAQGNIEDMMEIAPHIYFLFPHLEQIAPCDDQDTEGWKSVYGLVKMCQKVRNTEKKGLNLEA